MKHIMKKISLSLITIAILFTFSCNMEVGLGPSVDQKAPVVTFTSPEPRATVSQIFEVKGTASDNIDVTRFILSVGDDEWKYEDGSWTKNGSHIDNCEWTPTRKGSYEWTVRDVQIDTQDGEYTITINAYDARNNTSVDSVAKRTVVYDKHAPEVKVYFPALYDNLDEIKSDLDDETTHENYPMLSKYTNGSFEIKGTQDEKFLLMFLRVIIKDASDKIVWRSPFYLSNKKYMDDPEKREIIDKYLDPAEEPNYDKSDTLRNFSITVPDLSSSSFINGKTYLKIETISCDVAGNEEKVDDVTTKTQGYFCYWPESDKPWITFNKLSNSATDENELKKSKFYPSTKLQGYTYDDDGVAYIKVTSKLYNSTDTPAVLYEYNNPKDNNTYHTWTITAPSTDGIYEITIYATDTNNKWAKTITGYIQVSDVNKPNLSITEPPKTEALFGDEKGDFTFSDLYADDDSGVNVIKCVYIKDENSTPNYLNADYAGWDDISTTTTAGSADTDGNKRWYIDVKQDGTIDSLGGTRKKFIPKKPFKLNIFKDLGIDGDTVKLSGQHFIFYVQDNGGNKMTFDYAIQGDISAPKISFGELYVGTESKGKLADLNGKKLNENITNKTIKLTGTWEDDSMLAWKNVDKLSKFQIKFNNIPLTVTKTLVSGSNRGTWETEELVYAGDYAKGSVVSLIAEISDYAGNSASDKKGFTIDAEEARLESITANIPNGSYGKGTVIPIILKFNKSITVEGNPSLKLNNNATATFDTTISESQNLTFKYTVEEKTGSENQDIEKLNVDGINGKFTFKDSDTSVLVNDNTIKALSNENTKKNLADKKSIAIITGRPALTSAEINDTELTLSFNAPVSKNTGTITLTQTNVTNVPAVLTETEYRIWSTSSKILPTKLSDYYEKGTNGAKEDGSADLLTKYVLKYSYKSNNTTLVTAYKNANLHKVEINVRSSAVKVENNKLKINLTGTYELPCKGASYTVTVPEGLITNAVGALNTVPADPPIVNYGGVETPVIRIDKESWKLKDLKAIQPYQSEVQIDCQTPGAEISYGINSENFLYSEEHSKIDLKSKENSAEHVKPGVSPELPSTLDKYELPFKLGTDKEWEYGQKFFIAAEATKDKDTSDPAYETATKSVFVFDHKNGKYGGGNEREIVYSDLDDENRKKNKNEVASVWIRGGDAETGPVTTAGFPLSWDESDYKNGNLGAALLTQDETDDNLWYYITWELTTTAYIGVMAGVTDSKSDTKGPLEWTYSKNSFVPFKKWYCLFPGESRYVNADYGSNIWGVTRGDFGFKRTTTDRDGNEHEYDTSGSGSGGGGGTSGAFEIYTSDVKTVTEDIASGGLAGQYFTFNLKVDCADTFKEITIYATFETNDGDKTVTLEKGWIDNVYYNGQTFSINLELENEMTVKSIKYYCKFKFNPWITEEPTLTFTPSTEIGVGYSGEPVSGYHTDGEILCKQMDFTENPWAEFNIPCGEFSSVKYGNTIVITVSGQNVFQIGAYNNQQRLAETNGDWCNGDATVTGTDGVYTITIKLDAAEAAALKTNNMVIKGNNCTVTSVKIQ